jgi:aminoglycoside phosphotransferase (APT) family kinase protein
VDVRGVTELPDLSPRWQKGFAWLEAELGGRIVAARRQPRWRPAWFIELERGGERTSLYWRGQRGEIAHGLQALEREAGVLRVLEAEGIPVPHVHAVCTDPGGIIMDRSPGRANLATADSDAQRAAVLNDYVDVLARMHAIDPRRFEGLGLSVAEGEDQLGLGDLDDWIRGYRRAKSRPEPEIEWLLAWLLRNVPRGRSRQSFLCADAGQFLYDGDRVTALIDLELAYVGDPAADLGSLRCRDLSEPLGPIAPAIERYEARTGERIERAVLDYHAVRFATCTPLAVAPMLARAIPGLDHAQYFVWNHVYSKTPLEVIADGMGLELEVLDAPEVAETRFGPAADSLLGMLGGNEEPMSATERSASGGFEGYERDSALRVAQLLERSDRLGAEIEAQNAADIEAAFGVCPTSVRGADAFLEERIAEAGPDDDETFVRLLHRRLQRQGWIAEPVLREYAGARMQRVE